jgi:nitrite reductase/ring-hydroxylating ferredoxin subunit
MANEMANEWRSAVALTDLPEGKPIRVTADGSDVLLYRTGDRIVAASNRCTHQGAPLHRGVVRESGSLLTVTCPLHGSTFDLTDGRVLRGPATERLPVLHARVNDGMVEVRLQPSESRGTS